MSEERIATLCSSTVMFLSGARIAAICRALTGAHVPFSIKATVRFWRLCAAISRSSSSIVTKMPPLYVAEANTRWLHRKHSAMMSEAGVTDTSYIAVRTPRSRSFEARISAAFSVLP